MTDKRIWPQQPVEPPFETRRTEARNRRYYRCLEAIEDAALATEALEVELRWFPKDVGRLFDLQVPALRAAYLVLYADLLRQREVLREQTEVLRREKWRLEAGE